MVPLYKKKMHAQMNSRCTTCNLCGKVIFQGLTHTPATKVAPLTSAVCVQLPVAPTVCAAVPQPHPLQEHR